jgi:hypothetical protein
VKGDLLDGAACIGDGLRTWARPATGRFGRFVGDSYAIEDSEGNILTVHVQDTPTV